MKSLQGDQLIAGAADRENQTAGLSRSAGSGSAQGPGMHRDRAAGQRSPTAAVVFGAEGEEGVVADGSGSISRMDELRALRSVVMGCLRTLDAVLLSLDLVLDSVDGPDDMPLDEWRAYCECRERNDWDDDDDRRAFNRYCGEEAR